VIKEANNYWSKISKGKKIDFIEFARWLIKMVYF